MAYAIPHLTDATITKIHIDTDTHTVVLTLTSGITYTLGPIHDGSADIALEAIDGDLNHLLGSPLTEASYGDAVTTDEAEVCTTITLATHAGSVTITWVAGCHSGDAAPVDVLVTYPTTVHHDAPPAISLTPHTIHHSPASTCLHDVSHHTGYIDPAYPHWISQYTYVTIVPTLYGSHVEQLYPNAAMTHVGMGQHFALAHDAPKGATASIICDIVEVDICLPLDADHHIIPGAGTFTIDDTPYHIDPTGSITPKG